MITLEQGLKGNLCNCGKNILQVLLRITTGRLQILIFIVDIIYTDCIFIKAMINRNRNQILICFTLFLLVIFENTETFKQLSEEINYKFITFRSSNNYLPQLLQDGQYGACIEDDPH